MVIAPLQWTAMLRCPRDERPGHRLQSPAGEMHEFSRPRLAKQLAVAQTARCDAQDKVPHPDRASPAARSFFSRSSRPRSMSCISARVSGSSAPNGSSMSRIFGFGGQSAGQADTLPLTAGKLVRKAAVQSWLGFEPDRLQAVHGCGAMRSCRERPSASNTRPTLRSTLKCGKRPVS